MVSPDDDRGLPALFDLRGKAKHRVGLAGDGGKSHYLGRETVVLSPELCFAFALQIDDANVMGNEGGGDDLEAEGLSPEYLLDGCDAVFLFGDAATGVGRVDEQYVHGP